MDEEAVLAGANLPYSAVALTAREVFLQVLCQEPTEPTDAVTEKWLRCLHTALEICQQQLGVRWDRLARRLAMDFHGEDTWEQMPLGYRLAWEAAARAMVNWILVEGPEDRREMDSFDWKAWAKERMEKELT